MERHGPSGFELLVVAGGALVTCLGGVVWLGAWAAASVTGARWRAPFRDAAVATIRLPGHVGDPKLAWSLQDRAGLPGPLPYWMVTGMLIGAAALAAAVVLRLVVRSNVGTLPRRPLGVDARARFATVGDLKPLATRGRHRGRFPLGRHGRLLLATELPPRGKPQRRRGRTGDRGAVALIGPSRSGKTTAAVTGILEWEGPAVLSSVKADLLATTCGWRRRVGDVRVYDPTRTTGDESAGWSPLRAAKTVLGAQRAARALCEAAPRG